MKKSKLLLLTLSTVGLLAACNPSSNDNIPTDGGDPSIHFEDGDNFDVDPIEEIKEDTSEEESESSPLDEIIEEEGKIEVPETPEGYTSFKDGELKEDKGKYYLKGEYNKIWISAKKGCELFVYLDGVTIKSTEGIAFGSDKQITLHIIILNNSVNTISNDYTVSETLAEANAFHVKGNVYISGEGTLNVSSTVKSALKVSKDLYITSPVTINASGKSHAITAQSISVVDATLNVSSTEKDGLNAETDGEIAQYTTEQGFIRLENVDLTADTYGDGIQASTFIEIDGGKHKITTHGQWIAYQSSLISSGDYEKDDFKYVKSGSTYKRVASDEIRTLSSSYYAFVNSVKGIKIGGVEYEDTTTGTTKEVTSGDYKIDIKHLANIEINSSDDCIHCNYGSVNVNSSNFKLATFDDGMHADYNLAVDNCSITITSSYEGLEGSNVTIDGENTNIVSVSSDDGINAASDYGSSHNININNGYLRVYASGDGLDANTSLNINGGTVIVEGPGNNNGSLDAETVNINGGLIFACSTNGMQERTNAKQNTFIYQGSTMSSGATITVADSDNEALFSYTLKQSCNQLTFSSPLLKLGSKYTLLNGTSTFATVTLSSSLTKVGVNAGGGGSGGPGGGGPGGPGGR